MPRGLVEHPDVTVDPSDFVIPEVGSGAITRAKHLIQQSANLVLPGGVVTVLGESRREGFFSEAHHAARAYPLPAQANTLIGRAIMEGLATPIERAVVATHPLGELDDPIDTARWPALLRPTPHGRDEEWFYRQTPGGRGIGDRGGSSVVEKALKNSRESAASLVAVVPPRRSRWP